MPNKLDAALDALQTVSGSREAVRLLRDTLTYFHNEILRLQADNARLRAGDPAERTGEQRLLSVTAGDGSYLREQPVIVMKWTCEICGAVHEREQLPGNTPKYCPPAPGQDRSDCQKEATRRRVARHRAKQRRTATGKRKSVTDYAKPVTKNQPESLLNAAEYAEKYGLGTAEHRVMDRTSLERKQSGRNRQYLDKPPTAEQWRELKERATLTKKQACTRYGVSAYQFDKAKKLADMQHVSSYRAGTNNSGFINVGYVYRVADIEAALKLAGYLE